MTTRSAGRGSTGATGAKRRSSKRVKKAVSHLTGLNPAEREAQVLALVAPLLEMFAEIDDIFTEDDALAPAKRQMGMGRTYRAWKKCRAAMDPSFDALRDNRDRPQKSGPTMRTPGGLVLQPRRRRAQREGQA